MVDTAVRYAEALLIAAKQEDALAAVTEEMRILAQGFSPYAGVFSAPVFPVREQLATVSFVLDGNFHPLTARFVTLLGSMRRLGDIGRIAAAYDKMARREMGLIDLNLSVYAETAPGLAPKLIRAAVEKGLLAPDCREQDVELHSEVDESLLGGFVMECDGISWDCSLRARLAEMSKMILKEQR